MAWLLRDGEVLASVEVASSLAARSRGLLGKKSYEGALLLRHTRSVHTIGMRFAIDVAFLTGDLRVHRASSPCRPTGSGSRAGAAGAVLEAEAGAFERWGLVAGRPAGDQGVTPRRAASAGPGELVVVATPIGNIGDLSPRAAATLAGGGRRVLRGHAPHRPAARPPRPSGLAPALAARAQRAGANRRGARAARTRRPGRARQRRRHAGGLRSGRAGDRGGDRRRSPGHERARAVGGRRPRSWSPGSGPHAGASKASCRGAAPSAPSAWARSRRPRTRASSTRHRSGSAATLADLARLLRRRPQGGGLPRAHETLRGDLARDSRRGVRAAAATPPRGEHVLVVAGAAAGHDSRRRARRRSRAPSRAGCPPAPAAGRRRPRWRPTSACRSASPTRLRSPTVTGSLGACPAVSS